MMNDHQQLVQQEAALLPVPNVAFFQRYRLGYGILFMYGLLGCVPRPEHTANTDTPCVITIEERVAQTSPSRWRNMTYIAKLLGTSALEFCFFATVGGALSYIPLSNPSEPPSPVPASR